MRDFGCGGLSDGLSPDRLDALVWALAELVVNRHLGRGYGRRSNSIATELWTVSPAPVSHQFHHH
jgi:hypothetical protein